MKIHIKSIFGKLLFEGDFTSLGEAVAAAVKSCADLSSANLSSANLRDAETDYFDVLLRSKKEISGLRLAIVEGRINGSSYEGECACLVGTIANVAHCKYDELPKLKPDSGRPSERLFLAINKGDTPETNPISKIVLEWTDEFLTLLNS